MPYCSKKRKRLFKSDLFAAVYHRKKIDTLGDPLSEIDRGASHPMSAQDSRPSYLTETMVRIVVL